MQDTVKSLEYSDLTVGNRLPCSYVNSVWRSDMEAHLHDGLNHLHSTRGSHNHLLLLSRERVIMTFTMFVLRAGGSHNHLLLFSLQHILEHHNLCILFSLAPRLLLFLRYFVLINLGWIKSQIRALII